jgi:hypothetical protein
MNESSSPLDFLLLNELDDGHIEKLDILARMSNNIRAIGVLQVELDFRGMESEFV